MLFSRTGKNMYYRQHVDKSCVDDQRKDLSFTLFLNNSDDYEGGELTLYIPPEVRHIKLNAGEMIIYPTQYLHEVKVVNSGERCVCVGWIESLIESHADREILTSLLFAQRETEDETQKRAQKHELNIAINRLLKRFSA